MLTFFIETVGFFKGAGAISRDIKLEQLNKERCEVFLRERGNRQREGERGKVCERDTQGEDERGRKDETKRGWENGRDKVT